MKNVHLLPTDKPSRVWLSTKGEKYLIFDKFERSKVEYVLPKNIYITSSDEEIKEGDWVIFDTDIKTIVLNARGINLDTISVDKNIHVGYWVISKYCQKIILTTDQDLIKDGVQAIDDEFLEWFCSKNGAVNFVEVIIVENEKD